MPVEAEVSSEARLGKDPLLQGSVVLCARALCPVRGSAMLSRPSSETHVEGVVLGVVR